MGLRACPPWVAFLTFATREISEYWTPLKTEKNKGSEFSSLYSGRIGWVVGLFPNSFIHSPIHLSIHPSTQSTNPPIQSSSIKISWLSIHHIFYFHRECRIRFSIQKLLRFHSLTLKLSYEQTCDLFLQRAEALAWPSTHRSNESCLNCEALDPNPRLKERDLDMFRRWDWMQTCSPKSQSKITRRQDCSELTWLCFQVLECWLRRVISLWW